MYESNQTSPNQSPILTARPYIEDKFYFGGYRVPTWVGLKIFYGVEPGQWAIMPPYVQVVPLSVTPEPATMVLLGTGLGALAIARRKRKNANKTVTATDP